MFKVHVSVVLCVGSLYYQGLVVGKALLIDLSQKPVKEILR